MRRRHRCDSRVFTVQRLHGAEGASRLEPRHPVASPGRPLRRPVVQRAAPPLATAKAYSWKMPETKKAESAARRVQFAGDGAPIAAAAGDAAEDTWRTAYVVLLANHRLMWFSSLHAPKPLGVLELQSIASVTPMQPAAAARGAAGGAGLSKAALGESVRPSSANVTFGIGQVTLCDDEKTAGRAVSKVSKMDTVDG